MKVKNWNNNNKITLRSAAKRCNKTTGKLHCVNTNWAAIIEGIDALDIMLNVLYFVTMAIPIKYSVQWVICICLYAYTCTHIPIIHIYV